MNFDLPVIDFYDPSALGGAAHDILARFDPACATDAEYYASLIDEAKAYILELGSGLGRISFALAAKGHEVVGIDLSPSMVLRASERRRTIYSGTADR